MTPVVGLVAAFAAGMLLRSWRQAMLAVLIPYLVVLIGQTALLGSGRGTPPPSTAKDPGYWVVQVVALALALGVAAMLSAWRTRRGGVSTAAPAGLDRFAIVTGVLSVAAGLAGFLPLLLTQPLATHDADSNPPVFGVAGMMGLLIGAIVLGIMTLRSRRSAGIDRAHVGMAGG